MEEISPEKNDFTSITSYQGKAVVDFHITRQTDLNAVRDMTVKSAMDVVAELQIENLLSDTCRLPDHSLLTMRVELTMLVRDQLLQG